MTTLGQSMRLDLGRPLFGIAVWLIAALAAGALLLATQIRSPWKPARSVTALTHGTFGLQPSSASVYEPVSEVTVEELYSNEPTVPGIHLGFAPLVDRSEIRLTTSM